MKSNQQKDRYRKTNAKHWCNLCKVFVFNNKSVSKLIGCLVFTKNDNSVLQDMKKQINIEHIWRVKLTFLLQQVN